MKPWCMRRFKGGSELKGCLPVRRTIEALRGIQLSAVDWSRGSRMEGSNWELAFRIRVRHSSLSFSSDEESESESNTKCSSEGGGLRVRTMPFKGGWRSEY